MYLSGSDHCVYLVFQALRANRSSDYRKYQGAQARPLRKAL